VVDFVNKIVPLDINMTTFSVLFARFKGELDIFIEGINTINQLHENDEVLIAEACSHSCTKDDIGIEKIPKWLCDKLGFKLNFTKINGDDFDIENLKPKVIIHCGGCMIKREEMMARLALCNSHEIPITNYGVLISYIHDCLDRVIKMFK